MKTILLIDDDEAIRAVFGIALRGHGYRVFEAASGNAGLELARQQLPDLILTDIAMPDGDGEAVLKQIRQDPELSSKQVVLMTGDANAVTPRKGMESGADDFLVKPVNLEALLRCVNARLARAQVHWRVEDRILAKLQSSLRSNLPHEFFTPLGGIIGLTEILRSDFESLSPDEIKDMLKDLHLSGLRLHRSLRNYLTLLDFQVNSKETEPWTKSLSADELKKSLWSGIDAAVRRNKRGEDITVRFEAGPILAGASDVCLIVEELVDNACSYSRQGTPVDVFMGADGVLTVHDAGRGMSAEEIEQIGIFRQIDRNKREPQGLGLGLVLVRKIAERYGATFSMESTPSKGTMVRIAFRA